MKRFSVATKSLCARRPSPESEWICHDHCNESEGIVTTWETKVRLLRAQESRNAPDDHFRDSKSRIRGIVVRWSRFAALCEHHVEVQAADLHHFQTSHHRPQLSTTNYTTTPSPHISTMAFVATLARRAAAEAGGAGRDQVLKRGARRDPELYVCLTSPPVLPLSSL